MEREKMEIDGERGRDGNGVILATLRLVFLNSISTQAISARVP